MLLHERTRHQRQPAIDVDRLKEFGITSNLFDELTGLYFEQAGILIGAMKNERHTRLEDFRNNAHALKGISANMGALAMVEICQTLEKVQAYHSPKELNVLMHRLDSVYTETHFYMKQLTRETRRPEPEEPMSA